MASVFTSLQYLTSANDSSKSALDDFGQKWKHSDTQFELNLRFARSNNPDDESMVAGPGIYDNYNVRSTLTVKQVSTSAIADSSSPSRRLRPRPTGARAALSGSPSPKSTCLSTK